VVLPPETEARQVEGPEGEDAARAATGSNAAVPRTPITKWVGSRPKLGRMAFSMAKFSRGGYAAVAAEAKPVSPGRRVSLAPCRWPHPSGSGPR
jgi:hypothetical protein